jgi:hypothetical protein
VSVEQGVSSTGKKIRGRDVGVTFGHWTHSVLYHAGPKKGLNLAAKPFSPNVPQALKNEDQNFAYDQFSSLKTMQFSSKETPLNILRDAGCNRYAL